jgi:raffinose/stachyose/melibiose transport system permease protein
MENIFKLNRFEQILVQMILVFWSFVVITPIYIAVNNSFKETSAYVDESPFGFPPRAASGKLIFQGEPGTVVPVGTEFYAAKNDMAYFATKEATALKSGRLTIRVEAASKGRSGELPSSTPFKLVTSIAGIQTEGLVHPRGGIVNGLKFNPETYAVAWEKGNFGELFFNSVFISLTTVLIVVVLSTMTGFVLARMPFKGSNLILICFLVGMMIPLRLAMAPLMQVVETLGLLDSQWGVILVIAAMSMPMSVFILSSFFKQVSPELEQAARMDGATPFQIYFKVVIPMVKPAVASVALISFVWAWNEYFFPLIILSSPEKAPITLGMANFNTEFGRQWHFVFAGVIIMVLPTIVAFLLASKHFIAGLAAGGVKE